MEPNGVPARGEPPARPRLPGRRAEPGPDRTTCPDASSGPGTPPSEAEVLGLCAAAERALPGGAPPLAPDLLLAAAQLGWRVQAGAAARERIVALRRQVPHLSVQSRCPCGCGTAYFEL
ncbi:hypothetical protein AB0C89_35475, partial [Streptomyces sp. NPDC048491]